MHQILADGQTRQPALGARAVVMHVKGSAGLERPKIARPEIIASVWPVAILKHPPLIFRFHPQPRGGTAVGINHGIRG